MPRKSSIAISTGLIVSGAIACAFAARPLVNNPELDVPLNPMGINGSPYGEVFAMAMQSPIDNYFHAGMGEEHHHHDDDHVHDENCDHADHDAEVTPKPSPSLKNRFRSTLNSLSQVSGVRTNPKAASDKLRRHLRRQAEDQLRFAYRLDPSHYGNYNSLHFFLTEPQMGTRPQLSASAADLARDTIDYCLKKNDDPRAALTAASAASNILELMFNDRFSNTPQHFTTAQMRDMLKLLDQSLARYLFLAKQWDETKSWDHLSPMRIAESNERFRFITKVREAAESTLIQREQNH